MHWDGQEKTSFGMYGIFLKIPAHGGDDAAEGFAPAGRGIR